MQRTAIIFELNNLHDRGTAIRGESGARPCTPIRKNYPRDQIFLSANTALPANSKPAPPNTEATGRLNASSAHPATPHPASQHGHFRSSGVRVIAQALATA
jgi:hypothetical protein